MMKLIQTVLICLISAQLFATAQMPDYLIYNMDTLAIHANPLEAYFEREGLSDLNAFPELKDCWSTGCWRGYVGFWELRNDSIFLNKIVCCSDWYSDTSEQADLQEMFGDKCKNKEVFAYWVSAELIHPEGNQIKYIHQGYDSIYEFERGFDFVNGILQRTNVYDNTKSKESIFRTDSLFGFLLQTIDWNLVDELKLEDKKRVIARFGTDEDGMPIDIEIVRGINMEVDEEARRVVELIPEWDVYFRRGKVIETKWVLPIFFDKEFYEEKLLEERRDGSNGEK